MAVLSDEQVRQELQKLEGWSQQGKAIVRQYEFADFKAAMAFVNRVADAAESANHHPDILLHGWNKVRLTLSTHSQGGLTDADFRLASQIDRVA